MANVYEHAESRSNDARGAGRLDSRRVYVAELATTAEEPTEEVEAEVPRFSEHPDSRWKGLIATEYSKRPTHNPLVWFVDITYATPARIGHADWLTRVSFNQTTEHITRSLPTAEHPNGKIIGPYAYAKMTEAGPGAYTTETLKDGEIELYRVHNAQGGVRKAVGADVPGKAITISLHRTLNSMTAAIIRKVGKYVATANKYEFMGWEPGRLLFSDFLIEELDGQRSGQRQSGLVYPTELVFAATSKREGWTTLTMYDTFIDSEGNESVIMDRTVPDEASAPASDTFKTLERTNFDDMLRCVEGKSPRTKQRGKTNRGLP
jgi:hypothetical protein